MSHARRADLHLHTTCSDGVYAPSEVVRRAAEAGLDVVAITDHDSVAGIAEAMDAATKFGIQVLAGVELGVHVGEEEVHLLAYGFCTRDTQLTQRLALVRTQRQDRAEQTVERLQSLGVPLILEDVLACATGQSVGRPHIAEALVRGGFVQNAQEAFERLIGYGKPAFVPKALFPAREALAIVHNAGGVGVLAHPGQWTSETTIQSLIDAGLDGVEVVHPSHQPWTEDYYREMALRTGLLITGGSDFHGSRPADESNLGRFSIPVTWIEDLLLRKDTAVER